MDKIPFVRLSAEDLVPEHDDSYVDVGITKVLEELSWGDPLILKGPKGTGKTLAIEEFCSLVGAARVRQAPVRGVPLLQGGRARRAGRSLNGNLPQRRSCR